MKYEFVRFIILIYSFFVDTKNRNFCFMWHQYSSRDVSPKHTFYKCVPKFFEEMYGIYHHPFRKAQNSPVYQNQWKLVNWTLNFLAHPNVSCENTCFLHGYTFKNLAGLRNHLRSSKHEITSDLVTKILMCKWSNLKNNNLEKLDVEFIMRAKLTSQTIQQDMTFCLNLIKHHCLYYNFFTNKVNFHDILRIISDCLTKASLP